MAKTAIINIFKNKLFFKSFVKIELSYAFTINLFTITETTCNGELSYKTGRNKRQLLFNINAVVLIVIIC